MVCSKGGGEFFSNKLIADCLTLDTASWFGLPSIISVSAFQTHVNLGRSLMFKILD